MKKLNNNSIKIIALIAILFGVVFTSLAYFTDNKSVTNTFTFGQLEIQLDEPIFDEEENEGTKLLPGTVVAKDPTVTILADSEDTYVFMHVLNNLQPIIGDIDIADEWELVEYNAAIGHLYVYVGAGSTPFIVEHAATDTVLEALFTQIEVADDLDNAVFLEFDEDLANIIVSAYAHQALINGVADYATAKAAALAHYGY